MNVRGTCPEEYAPDPRQQELAARIAGRRGAVRGPFARFDRGLPKHLRELTPLMAARNGDAQYSWNAPVHQATEAGVPEAAVQAIAEKCEARPAPRPASQARTASRRWRAIRAYVSRALSSSEPSYPWSAPATSWCSTRDPVLRRRSA